MPERTTEDLVDRLCETGTFIETAPVVLDADDRYVLVAASIDNQRGAQSVRREIWFSADGVRWAFGGAAQINQEKAQPIDVKWMPLQVPVLPGATLVKGRCIVTGRNLLTRLRIVTSDQPIDSSEMSRDR